MKNKREDYLVWIENELYTIKIFKREAGYYACSYNILNDHHYHMYESSQGKICLRLLRTFELYADHFSEQEMNMIINDILAIARKLNISKYYVERIFNGRKGAMNMSNSEWKKPSKPLRQKYHTDYQESSIFSSNARLLQSIWREKDLQLKEMGTSDRGTYLGGFLPLEKAKQKGLNFLNDTIFNVVKREIESKEAKSLIMEPRIWNNMLSSQPLCFNLFAELMENKNLATKLFSSMFPNRVSEVTELKFEYSPGRQNEKYTNDGSAFDVFVTYHSSENKKGFIGIEVKYAENMKEAPSEHKDRYEEIMAGSGIFHKDQLAKLKESPIQQIWRDHLLALSMYKMNDDYEEGMFVFLYPEKNIECEQAVEKYKETFLEPDEEKNDFYPRTLEEVIAILRNSSSEDWIEKFYDRYLHFSKINELES